MHNDDQVNDYSNNGTFICGVVEGFYGKPWSFEQRKDLFKKLKDLRMSSFMYAPKDDIKHRNKWRELYSAEEAKELKILINEAKANGVDFYYSLAPGLDMIYSERNEVELMVRKYDQLVELGCQSFAILFDDIEPSIINERDCELFKNYASAQVYVTNLIYEHLKRPKFLFCPTEYCQSRAVPNVPDSSYLNTIGTGLSAGIDIMWSGSRVISRLITEESIEELSKVIRRPPVIWENLHANDYDKKRVFLGPYSGRSTKIIPKLRGVLTNPNCEYEANHVAIHTLAQWSRCSQDGSPHNCCNRVFKNPDADGLNDVDSNLAASKVVELEDPSVYDPHKALMLALKDWLPRLLDNKSPVSGSGPFRPRNDELASNQLAKETDETAPEETPMVLAEDSEANNNNNGVSRSDMETSDPTNATQACQGQPVESNSSDSCDMQATNEPSVGFEGPSVGISCLECAFCAASTQPNRPTSIDLGQLCLLVDLFYLPFEHGPNGQTLLRDIKWLRDNSDVLIVQQPSSLASDNSSSSQQCKQTKEADISQSVFSNHPNNDNKNNSNKNNNNDHAEHHDSHHLPPEALAMSETNQQTGSGGKSNVSNKVDESSLSFASSSANVTVHNRNNEAQTIWSMRADRLRDMCNCISELVDTMEFNCPNRLLVYELYPYLQELRNLASMVLDYIKYLRFLRYDSADPSQISSSEPVGGARQPECLVIDDQEPWVYRGGLIGDVQRLLAAHAGFEVRSKG